MLYWNVRGLNNHVK
jgi:exonuclease III